MEPPSVDRELADVLTWIRYAHDDLDVALEMLEQDDHKGVASRMVEVVADLSYGMGSAVKAMQILEEMNAPIP